MWILAGKDGKRQEKAGKGGKRRDILAGYGGKLRGAVWGGTCRECVGPGIQAYHVQLRTGHSKSSL